MKEAAFYEKLPGGAVRCGLCPHHCVLEQGKTGACSARINDAGTLFAQSYGAVTSMALDPVEKKPLRRFYPGTVILSIGSYGCNFRCAYCQNNAISINKASFELFTPDEIAAKSAELSGHGNIGVAYTYNEPIIGYEFVLDCARLVRKQKQKNVLITNGFIAPEPRRALLPYIDAMNIDLKAFAPGFYKLLGGRLEDVKRTIMESAGACHVEVTTLIIPGKNDSEEDMKALSRWLAEVSPEIPLHVSRFFPAYKWQDIPPAEIIDVYRLATIARRNLRYVYTGNC